MHCVMCGMYCVNLGSYSSEFRLFHEANKITEKRNQNALVNYAFSFVSLVLFVQVSGRRRAFRASLMSSARQNTKFHLRKQQIYGEKR